MKKSWEIYNIDDLPNEKWELINGTTNYYVSNLSRIKSNERYIPCKNGKRKLKSTILKQSKNTHGYLSVHIREFKGYSNRMVHILVANAFLPNPLNLPQVSHLDHDRANPSLSNLKWETAVGNMQQSVKDGRMNRGEMRPCSLLKENDVIEIFQTKMSYRKMASIFSVSFSTIQEIKSNKTWAYLTKNYEPNIKNRLSGGVVRRR